MTDESAGFFLLTSLTDYVSALSMPTIGRDEEDTWDPKSVKKIAAAGGVCGRFTLEKFCKKSSG
ncbi:MAG: hypothetical protein JSR82_24860 [Verrucomicrobia bacterium]|nr:hypothetical protein [Verrucomicrobiota bacterium]